MIGPRHDTSAAKFWKTRPAETVGILHYPTEPVAVNSPAIACFFQIVPTVRIAAEKRHGGMGVRECGGGRMLSVACSVFHPSHPVTPTPLPSPSTSPAAIEIGRIMESS